MNRTIQVSMIVMVAGVQLNCFAAGKSKALPATAEQVANLARSAHKHVTDFATAISNADNKLFLISPSHKHLLTPKEGGITGNIETFETPNNGAGVWTKFSIPESKRKPNDIQIVTDSDNNIGVQRSYFFPGKTGAQRTIVSAQTYKVEEINGKAFRVQNKYSLKDNNFSLSIKRIGNSLEISFEAGAPSVPRSSHGVIKNIPGQVLAFKVDNEMRTLSVFTMENNFLARRDYLLTNTSKKSVLPGAEPMAVSQIVIAGHSDRKLLSALELRELAFPAKRIALEPPVAAEAAEATRGIKVKSSR